MDRWQRAFMIGGLTPGTTYKFRLGGGTFRNLSVLTDEPRPGTPVADDFTTIAAKLREIEAEKARERQAAEEKK